MTFQTQGQVTPQENQREVGIRHAVSTSYLEAYFISEAESAASLEPSSSTIGEKQPSNAWLHSLRFRNRTSKDVLIGRLPPELLTRIFIIITTADEIDFEATECMPRCKRSAAVLSGVCYDWRQLAIRTCQLWSHVDIWLRESQSYLSLAKLWLERAGGALLDIHVHSESVLCTNDESVCQALLGDRVAQFRSLHVMSYSSDFLASMVNFWLNDRNSRPLDTLVLSRWFCSRASEKLPLQPNPLLLTVRTLKLCGVFINWDYVIIRNLVELELHKLFPRNSLTEDQLSQLISACPELRSLSINQVRIRRGSTSLDRSPVKVDKLDSFTLGHLPKGRSTRRLLRLIGSVSPSLCLSLQRTFCSTQEAVDEIIDFCNRVNIRKICFGPCRGPVEAAAEIIVNTPSLETLVLHDIALTQGFFDIMARPLEASPSDISTGKEPALSYGLSLQNLHIRECVVIPSRLCELVQARSIKHLEIWCCKFLEGLRDFDSSPAPERHGELPVGLQEWLQDNVPSFHFTAMYN